MTPEVVFIVLVVAIALAFDFINGFHDSANSIATVVGARVLTPGVAVVWAAFFSFVAAFTVGTAVAKTVSKGLIDRKMFSRDARSIPRAPPLGWHPLRRVILREIFLPSPTAECRVPSAESRNENPPLSGLRIVEFAGIGPAPLAGMLLADLGADVVVVERPNAGGIGSMIPRRHLITNRGKRLTIADLKSAAGRDAVFGLVDRADGLIEGFRPGTMERLGLGPDQVLARNPRLVFGRLTGWGQRGPLAATAGHDINYIALTGGLDAIGRAGGPPLPPVNFLGDYAGGTMFAVTGVLAALLEARRSGRGQVVDAAMIDGVGALLAPMMGMLSAGAWTPVRGQNLFDTGAPFYDVYPAADGRFVAVGALEDEFFAALVEGLGLPAGVLVTRWDRATWPELRRQIAAAIGQKTRDAWTAVFAGSDACVAPVLSIAEAARDEHQLSRQGFVDVEGQLQPAPAPRFSRTPPRPPTAPPVDLTPIEVVLSEWGNSPSA